MKRTTHVVLLLVIAGAGPTSPAPAQNALGDGRALDSNLQQGTGGRNQPGMNLQRELAFRNSIVTGSIAGGRHFRGEVGYTAADDFRGAVAGDDFYAFERDSFYSGLATLNLNGIDALQGSLGYSVGGQAAGAVNGPLIVRRSGGGVSVGTLRRSTEEVNDAGSDMFGLVRGVMRAPSLESIRTVSAPDLLSVTRDDNTGSARVLSASPILGIRVLPGSSDALRSPGEFLTDDFARLPDPLGVPAPTDVPDIPMAPAHSTGEGDEPEAPSESDIVRLSPHAKVIDALRNGLSIPITERATLPARAVEAPGAPGAPEAPRGSVEIVPDLPPTDTDETEPSDDPDALENQRTLLERRLEQLRRKMIDGEPDWETDPNDETAAGAEAGDENITAESLARDLLTGRRVRVEVLADPTTVDTVYARHLNAGQALLGEGKWFFAEERFTAALGIRMGDPMAAVGRVMAQIGAGMFRSAAHNLRNLFRAYPEFLAVRLDTPMLPGPDRLEALTVQLRERISRPSLTGFDAALLLAYLGHQFDRADLITDGLLGLMEIETALGLEPDPLYNAIRGAWAGSRQ